MNTLDWCFARRGGGSHTKFQLKVVEGTLHSLDKRGSYNHTTPKELCEFKHRSWDPTQFSRRYWQYGSNK